MTGYFSKQQQQRQRQKYPSYQEIRIGMNAAATASSFYGNAFSADDSCWCRIGGGIVCFYRRMWLEFVELASRENTSPLRLWPTETEIPTAYDYELSLAGKYIALEDLIKEEVEEEGRVDRNASSSWYRTRKKTIPLYEKTFPNLFCRRPSTDEVDNSLSLYPTSSVLE